MEFIESVMWVGLGFVPTMALLELASRRRGRIEKVVGRKGMVATTGIAAPGSEIEGKVRKTPEEEDVRLYV